MDEYIGVIRSFAGSYAPQGWAICDGSLLPVRQYTALFSILGIQYGGDGKVNFALPDLRGLMAVGAGTVYNVGEAGGVATNALGVQNMPLHGHPVSNTVALTCNMDGPNSKIPVGNVYSIAETNAFASGFTAGAQLAPLASASDYTAAPVGTGTAYDNRMPYLSMLYIICIEGNFPPRN